MRPNLHLCRLNRAPHLRDPWRDTTCWKSEVYASCPPLETPSFLRRPMKMRMLATAVLFASASASVSAADCDGCETESTSFAGVLTDPDSGVQISLQVIELSNGACALQQPGGTNCAGVSPCGFNIQWSVNGGPCGTASGSAKFRVNGSGSLPGTVPSGTIELGIGALAPGEGASGVVPVALDCGGRATGTLPVTPNCADQSKNDPVELQATAECTACSN